MHSPIRSCVAALLFFLVAPIGVAIASPITATGTYANIDPGASDTVTVTAVFDPAGINGVGTEFVQVTSLVFDFSKLAFLQMPTAIVPQTPPYNQGTFLAQYTDGAFEAIVSQGGGGGLAQADARVSPTRVNLIKQYISMGIASGRFARLSELFEFSGLAGEYELDLSVDSYSLVPEPGAAALVAFALCTLGVRRRAH